IHNNAEANFIVLTVLCVGRDVEALVIYAHSSFTVECGPDHALFSRSNCFLRLLGHCATTTGADLFNDERPGAGIEKMKCHFQFFSLRDGPEILVGRVQPADRRELAAVRRQFHLCQLLLLIISPQEANKKPRKAIRTNPRILHFFANLYKKAVIAQEALKFTLCILFSCTSSL